VGKTKEEIIFRRVLKSRGLLSKKQINDFLNPDYAGHPDPYLLPDMKEAVARLGAAQKRGQKVCIYGDYDVDGLSATALLLDAFDKFKIDAFSYIPNRFTEGYGIGKKGLEFIAKAGAKLVVTVDCGSRSHQEIKYAKKLGMDVIVTDHHSLDERLPEAVAVINPKRPDSKYPFNELAGVGVAFKLAEAMQKEMPGLPEGREKWLLDLVCLGTVCDVVPLTGENRALAYWGLKVINKTRRPGLIALSERARAGRISEETLGYVFGPRLNAAGRLKSAQAALELLTASAEDAAAELANRLEEQNSARKRLQNKIFKEAAKEAKKAGGDDVLVLAGKGWSHGVVGIVASKIVEEFNKPAFVLELQSGGTAKGSARSVEGFDLARAINAAQKHLEKGGGHAMAAGVTLKTKNLAAFKKAVNEQYRKQKPKRRPAGGDNAALSLKNLSGVSLELAEMIERLAPFGPGNERPSFYAKLKILQKRPVGADKKHVKLVLADGDGNIADGIGFNLAAAAERAGFRARVVFCAKKNIFNGQTGLQLKINSIAPDS